MNKNLIVPFADLKSELPLYKDAVVKSWSNIVDNTQFIGGKSSELFEKEYASFTCSKHAIGISNGTVSLLVALMALGCKPSSKVIVPANSFIATAEAVSILGAEILFVDVHWDTCLIDFDSIPESYLEEADFIIPVHLYGQMVDMKKCLILAEKYEIQIIEDAAQAHLATFDDYQPGHFSKFASYSFYPGKNLGAWGDAGALTTNDSLLSNIACEIANHGSKKKYHHVRIGGNFRMPELQAAVLLEKLKLITEFTEKRRKIASIYLSEINNKKIELPVVQDSAKHSWHLFVIKCKNRDELSDYLSSKSISTSLHYPIPLHETEAYRDYYKDVNFNVSSNLAKNILSLPMFPMMTDEQIEKVISSINNY